MKRFATLFFALLGIASVAHADDQDNLLPVDQAFRVEATAPDRQTVQFKFAIADDYYLYRGRISTKAADAATTLGALDLPDGKKKHDEFLGDVEVYHHGFTATQHLTAAPDATNAVIELRYQGCHEVDPKICFPPQKKILTIALPAAPAATAPASLTAALGTATGNASASSLIGGNQPLPAEQAFRFEAIATGPDQVLARFTMPKGYYLYRDKTSFHTAADSGDSLGTPAFPAGTQHSDANFGATTVYFDQVDIPVPLSRTNNAAHTLALTANFQGCKENSVCYPMLERTLTVSLPTGSGAAVSVTPITATGSLLAALFAALLGGLVLNLMPCVLPVLSLKAISILESGESPVAARRHVLFYTAGVLISFAVVGLAVIALRKAGLIYGWGFQLQQPLFVAVLIYVIVAIGLSLSGVVQFGAGLGNTGQSLSARSGASGDFFTGVLAVVVASPCTAPFMGTALAFAFANSALAAFCVFIALGLGLALPFLLIGFVPGFARWLPKPGAWMETLKQVLAFPMYLTAVWLVWVLGSQRGVDAIGLVLAGAVLLSLGLWWFERSRYKTPGWRALSLVALLLSLPPLYWLAYLPAKQVAAAQVNGQVAFNPAKLEELRKAGQTVFVDIGADWCTTCKVNEHAVLDTAAFRALLDETHATLMTGDWTNPDRDIEAFLARFHAVGVPLYVVFRNGDDGRVLPTVLTQSVVRAALVPAQASP
ncbi:MAG: protein-disulfide reductase [Xanthomonadales bacterium PRO7]|nr:protein-disulfide reductase [Xanthomonadales bacterium PRO7]HMM56094.1 protein-disulfide reductase DsbD [Rudaea sp.]